MEEQNPFIINRRKARLIVIYSVYNFLLENRQEFYNSEEIEERFIYLTQSKMEDGFSLKNYDVRFFKKFIKQFDTDKIKEANDFLERNTEYNTLFLKAIIIAAQIELKYLQTARHIICNEYTNIAAGFFDIEVSFINAMLNKL